MALEYRCEKDVAGAEADVNKRTLLENSTCIIQEYLRDPSAHPYIICARFADEQLAAPEDLIQCSSHGDKNTALDWLTDLPPLPGKRLYDWVCGTPEEFIEDLPLF
jgi:hypothetical protein